MSEEKEQIKKELSQKVSKKPQLKKKRKRLSKIPTEVLLSPGGMVLIVYAVFMEALDLLPGGSLTWEFIPEIIFLILLSVIAGVPFRSLIFPLLIERIPLLSDILPTWVIRMIM
jgi:hypothetical protein